MELIDTHAHIQEDAFEADRAEVLARAFEAGVKHIVVVGFNVASSRRAVELAQVNSRLSAVVGIQPNYAHEARPADWETIVELAQDPSVVGIGETGLDLYWKTVPIELQKEYFHRHLQLSKETGLPFVVHCRDADVDIVVELRKAAQSSGPLNGVMHSFTGTMETAQACWELGLHISFAGMITFKNNHALRSIAAAVPPDRLMIETDCPYLAPSPNRGKRNEPAFITLTADCLAGVRGLSAQEFADLSTANAQRLFRLSATVSP